MMSGKFADVRSAVEQSVDSEDTSVLVGTRRPRMSSGFAWDITQPWAGAY